MEPQNGVKTWQWVVTIIVIIVLIVIGIFVFGSKKTVAPLPEETATLPTEDVGASYRIVLSDQFPGNVVYVSSVQAENPVWLVVQKDNNGVPGAIIGSAHFDAGISPGKINLTESTIDGKTYYAVMYADDGTGKFDATTATTVKDASGNVIMKIFHATATANIDIKG